MREVSETSMAHRAAEVGTVHVADRISRISRILLTAVLAGGLMLLAAPAWAENATTAPSADLRPQALYSGECGAQGGNLTWTLDTTTGILTISGTGAMKGDYYYANRPWLLGQEADWGVSRTITKIVIDPGVTSIGSQAFYGSLSLRSLTIPDSVTSIGRFAFADCGSLASVIVPESVTSIGESAFANCTSLKAIALPAGLTSISNSTFNNCPSLASVNIPDSVTSIGRSAFAGCDFLSTLIIPSHVTSIGMECFRSCSSLTSIIIPESVTSIGEYAFADCTSLKSIALPAALASIDKDTFRNCTSLASVAIPESVTSIGDEAFYGCFALASVNIPESVTFVGQRAFGRCKGPIYCAAPSRPNDWEESWDSGYGGKVVWGSVEPADPELPGAVTPPFTGKAVTLSSALVGGRNIDIPARSTASGAQAIIWSDTPGANQRFYVGDAGDGAVYLQNVNSGLVLDINGAHISKGAAIIQWPWKATANQKWHMEEAADGSYVIASALNPAYCLDIFGGQNANGAKLILWEKGAGKPNQSWDIDEITPSLPDGTYTIRTAGAGNRSLDVEGGSTTDGARMLLYDFHGAENQQFTIHFLPETGYYTIVGLASKKSLDVYAGSTAAGAQIIQWQLHSRLNQQWSIEETGAENNSHWIIGAQNNLSLDVYGGNVANNGRIIAWPYHGQYNQQWAFEELPLSDAA